MLLSRHLLRPRLAAASRLGSVYRRWDVLHPVFRNESSGGGPLALPRPTGIRTASSPPRRIDAILRQTLPSLDVAGPRWSQETNQLVGSRKSWESEQHWTPTSQPWEVC